MSTLSNHWYVLQPFLMYTGLLSIISANCGHLVKMLINHMVYLDQMLHTYLFEHCPATGMQNGEEFLLLNHMVYLDQMLHTYLFEHCPATGMQNGEESLPSIILGGRGILVKMLITLEPHHIFGSNFAFLYIFEIGWENDKEKTKK